MDTSISRFALSAQVAAKPSDVAPKAVAYGFGGRTQQFRVICGWMQVVVGMA